jgi:hypothetical protein
MTTGWLVECLSGGLRTYYCGGGEWCSLAGHAKKFHTREEAMAVKKQFASQIAEYQVAEHAWV